MTTSQRLRLYVSKKNVLLNLSSSDKPKPDFTPGHKAILGSTDDTGTPLLFSAKFLQDLSGKIHLLQEDFELVKFVYRFLL